MEGIASIVSLLGAVGTHVLDPFSIAIVPEQLRKSNEDAYVPKVVSIGPRYKGSGKHLQQMEGIKWRCMLSLLYRRGDVEDSFGRCINAIFAKDGAVRASYVDEINLDRDELATIMLVDGCFLLELLITADKELNVELRSHHPGPGAEVGKMEEVLSDLTLLENQIPLFILCELFRALFASEGAENDRIFKFIEKRTDDDRVFKVIERLALSLFGYPASSVDSILSSDSPPKSFPAHFFELFHSSIPGVSEKLEHNREIQHSSIVVETSKEVGEAAETRRGAEEAAKTSREVEHHRHVDDAQVKMNRCATRLQAAGVTIKTPHTESEPGNSKFVRRLLSQKAERKHVNKLQPAGSSFNFDIKFIDSDGRLEIPPLHITETTEARWRNLIAWEHHKMKLKSSSIATASAAEQGTTGFSCKCTSSALLFNGLVCSADDVQLLKDRKVIVDHSNMINQDLVAFFRSITKGVDPGIVDSSYSKMFGALNKYSATPEATRIPMILWHYLRRTPELIYSLIYGLLKFLSRGYNFAAAIISLLTVVQTIYAILSYHDPK